MATCWLCGSAMAPWRWCQQPSHCPALRVSGTDLGRAERSSDWGPDGARAFNPASFLDEPGVGCPLAPLVSPAGPPPALWVPSCWCPLLGPRAGRGIWFPSKRQLHRDPHQAPSLRRSRAARPTPHAGPSRDSERRGACFSKTHSDIKPAFPWKQSL